MANRADGENVWTMAPENVSDEEGTVPSGFHLKIARWFKYGDGAVRDHGWGCVYRNVQTVRAFNDMKHVGIWEMVQRCRPKTVAVAKRNARAPRDKTAEKLQCLGMGPASQVASLTDLWIEPPDVKQCGLLPQEHTRTVLFSPNHTKLMSFLHRAPRLSTLEDFDEVTCSKEHWFDLLRTAVVVSKQPVILDDKCFSYLFYGADADCALVVDPHQPNKAKGLQRMSLHALFDRSWMAVFYSPPPPPSPSPPSPRRRPLSPSAAGFSPRTRSTP